MRRHQRPLTLPPVKAGPATVADLAACGSSPFRLSPRARSYEAAAASAPALERPYACLASLLNCRPDEIAVLSSATAAWQQVVYGLAWAWRPGDRLLTCVSEYGSNYIAFLQLARRTGVRIEVVPETAAGDVDLQALEEAILRPGKPRPVLISLTHVPTSSGRVYDAAGVGVVAKKHGVLYLLDACQSVGQISVDVSRIRCDFLSGTGRKFLRAPRGSGFLFCSAAVLGRFEPAALDNTGATWTGAGAYALHPTARRFQSYEMSFAAKVGLGVAAQQCLDLGVGAIAARVKALAGLLRAALAALRGVRVLDVGTALCGIVSFDVRGVGAGEVQRWLKAHGVTVSVSAAPSTRLDFERRGLSEVVRASVHYYNTEAEVRRLAGAVGAL
jgi:selenocysteine lyase/cysteine desulfurase